VFNGAAVGATGPQKRTKLKAHKTFTARAKIGSLNCHRLNRQRGLLEQPHRSSDGCIGLCSRA
jgi:hypothetical protein